MSRVLISSEKFWQRILMRSGKKTTTLVDMCAKAGVSYTAMRSLKSRHSLPDVETIYKIACALDVTFNDLLYDYESPKSFL